MHGLTVNQCVLEVDEAIFGGSEKAHYDTVNFSSPFRYTTTEVSQLGVPDRVIDCPGGTLSNSLLFCGGKGVRVDKVIGSLLLNPGEVEAEVEDGNVR